MINPHSSYIAKEMASPSVDTTINPPVEILLPTVAKCPGQRMSQLGPIVGGGPWTARGRKADIQVESRHTVQAHRRC